MRSRPVIVIVSLGLSFTQAPEAGAGGVIDFRELEKVVLAELKETDTPGAVNW